MLSDPFIRDTAGRPLALRSHNEPLPPVPAKVCMHGVLCPVCSVSIYRDDVISETEQTVRVA
jgi:hypothetical protein